MLTTIPNAPTGYTDTGCLLAPSCLRCPIPDGCAYDYGVTPTEVITIARDLVIQRRIAAGYPAVRVAADLGVGVRTAHRAAGTARSRRRQGGAGGGARGHARAPAGRGERGVNRGEALMPQPGSVTLLWAGHRRREG